MEDFQPMSHLKLQPLPIGLRMNYLDNMFEMQAALMDKYKWHDGKTKEEITAVFAQAIASEAQELINNCNWKPWKESKKNFNYAETVYEYIDILHFVINGLIALGVTPKECMQYYLAKNKENHKRIGRNY